jgi:hypothetical protein
MPETWVALAAGGLLAVGLALALTRRREVVAFADEREERLARRVARAVGCSPAQALPAVRRELGFAPHQSDDTLVKRAVYHYRRDIPESSCPIYPDRAPG